ncbi:MAG: tyrosine-type recombinase/integrase [Bacillota bacterium]
MASIREYKNKDGKVVSYDIRVYKGRDSFGKPLKPYLLTWKVPEGLTEKQVEKELNRQAVLFEQQCKQGLVADSKYTFEKYSQYVLALKERNGIKLSTLERYRLLLQRINPLIGHMKIADVRPQHLNKLYEELGAPDVNKRNGSGLSNKTILEHHRIISTIFSQAEKEMLVPYNPASKATPPKVERKEANYFQTDVIKSILSCLESESLKWKLLVHMLLITGARRGEILGLKWTNVDWKEKCIHICNNLLYSPSKGIYLTTPKTTKSKRPIKLPAETMELLKEYNDWYLQEKLSLGTYWQDDDFIFVQYNGAPMHPDSVTDYLKKFGKKYHLPHINPHAFRHTAASLLIFSGVDIVSISDRLGHALPSTSANLYGHLIKEADEQSAEKLADIVLR